MKLASSRFRHATFVESLLSVTCTVLILIFLFVAGGEDLGINAECGFSATTVQEQATRVFVDPPNSTANVGENYTISVKIANVTNLAGFSIGIRWGSAVLRYRSHEVYPDNVIFNPWLIREELNQTYGVSEAPPGTIYLVAYASLPSAGFNGSGTVFNMTFHVLRDGECSISFTVSELSTPGPSPSPISHTLADGYFFKPGLGKVPVAEFTVQGGKKPGTAVENRITIFNASASYDQDPLGNIALYIWNFGDGVTANTTDPVTAHNYTNLLSTPYLSFYLQVELTVLDDQLDGSQSQPKHESLEIVHPRPVANFTFWPRIAVIGKTVIFNASSSYDPDPDGTIVLYSWYFWTSYSVNTTNPVINLTFADAYTYAVFLTVYDSEGLNDVEAHAVPVVESRDVEVASVTTSTTKFMQGKDVGLNATVFNRGQADETFNITAYYNKTATEWEKIDELVAKRVPGQNRTLSPSYPVEPIVWYLTQRESTCSPANNKLYSHWDSLGPSDTSTRVRAGDDSGYWTVNPRSINAESNSSTLVAGTPLETGGWTLEKEFALGPMLINGDFSSGNWTVSLKLFATADGITATIWMRVLKSDNPNFQAAEANVEVLKNWTCLFEPVILSTQANLITSRLPMPISLFDYEYLYVEFQLEVTENDAVGSDAEVAFEVEGFTDPLSLARIEPTAFSSKEEYTLRWNTEGVPPGNYAVKVVLSEVPHETNATNNIRVSENTIVVLVEGRDIALTAVNLSKSVVGQGFPLIVNLTVRNFGSVQETFNITLYANETIIETLTSTVAERTVSIMTCCWNTTGFAKGAYILWANASSVPGELDTSDNISADHAIFITIAGDVDEDRDVDLSDAIEFVRCYRVHPILNPNADIDEDGDVDIYDVVILCGNYGKSW